MYDGGEVDVNDKNSIGRNKGDKSLIESDWTDTPTESQAQRPSNTALSSPPIEGDDAEDEEDLMAAYPPQSDKAQPESRRNEMGPDRQGDAVPDMSDQHNNKRKPYAMGGAIKMADDDQDLLMSDEPDGDHSEEPSSSYDESHDYGTRSGDPSEVDPHTGESESDMLQRHAMERASFAKGGPINPKLAESKKMPPMPDEDEDDATSLVGEIMSKRKKMADGGEVDGSESLANEIIAKRNSQPGARQNKRIGGSSDDQADLNRNSRESLNQEDQMSFNAGKKELYDDDQISAQPRDSNEKGDSKEADEENEHDGSIVSQIMKKRKKA